MNAAISKYPIFFMFYYDYIIYSELGGFLYFFLVVPYLSTIYIAYFKIYYNKYYYLLIIGHITINCTIFIVGVLIDVVEKL
jgi:hypothetical protein